MPKIKNFRWWICGLIFMATSLSFLDRQVLSVVAPLVTEEFNMDNTSYSRVVSYFLLSYTVMFFLGGRIIDWLGTRVGLALSVGFWSIASAIHGIVMSPFQMGFARFFLGFGEGGCFPGAVKGATEWFPQKERALALGIAIGGAAFGAVVAPPLTVWAVDIVGWRGAFVATGAIGGIWVLLWLIFYRPPRESSFVTESERNYIINGQPTPESPTSDSTDNVLVPLKTLFKMKEVWGLSMIRFLIDPVFYFYMFWIPQYLNQERGISLSRIGEITWIPFFALGVFNIVGGWVTDRMIKSGMSVNRVRKSIMTAAAAITPFSVLAAYAHSAEMAIFFMTLLMFAHGFFITNFVTIISDLFNTRSVSTVMGISGMFGGIGGYLSTLITGPVVDHFSFLPIWIASGCMYPLAVLVMFLTIGTIKGRRV